MNGSSIPKKVAFITGASRGIGAAVAVALARRGHAVVLAVRDPDSAEATLCSLRDLDASYLVVACDVADDAQVDSAVKAALDAFGRLDAVVNNAGQIQPIGRIHESCAEEWANAITTNLVGPYHVTRATLPMLVENAGVIVNLSTGAAHAPREGWSAYCSSKAGLSMLTRCTAHEYGELGVAVYGLQPGLVDSDMQGLIRASGMNEISRVPREKLAPPSLCADVIAWLADERPVDLRGQDLTVNDAALMARVTASHSMESAS